MSTSKNEFIVAIELGSSKLTAMAGHMQPDGNLNVLAVKEIPSTGFMLYGAVHNLEKTKSSLKEAIDYLQNTLQKRISKVYVALECQGMHSEEVTKSITYSTDTITQEMVAQIQSEAKATHQLNMMTHHSYPIEYRVGGQVINGEPVGVLGDSIEGRYVNIVTRRSVFENLERSFNDTGLEDVSFRIATRALRSAILQESETRSTCMMIDFGAQLTTVAIYDKSKLRHLAVLPLGSANITKDLMSLGIEEAEAEMLKRKYGAAFTEVNAIEELGDKDHLLRDGRTIKQSLILEIVEARMQEILANVREQMRMNHYRAEDFLGGVIVTGGGSNLSRMREAIVHTLGIEKVRIAATPQFTVVGQLQDIDIKSGAYNTLFGLIKRAKDNCCAGDLHPNTPQDLFAETSTGEETPETTETKKSQPTTNIEGEVKTDVPTSPITTTDLTLINAPEEEEEKKPSPYEKVKKWLNTLFNGDPIDETEDEDENV